MQLHWDGNNPSLAERNLSAAIGAGVTPETVDHAAIERVADWLRRPAAAAQPAPARSRPRSSAGARSTCAHCAACHGYQGEDGYVFEGARLGKVEPDRAGSAPIRAGSIPTPRRSAQRQLDRAVRRHALPVPAISARPTATPTCRSTGCGCAAPICTTARCRRCATCLRRRRSGRRPSCAASISSTAERRLRRAALRRRAGRAAGLLLRHPLARQRQRRPRLRHHPVRQREGRPARLSADLLGELDADGSDNALD